MASVTLPIINTSIDQAEKEFDFLVFIARCQPFHTEHKRIIQEALHRAKNVIVLLGSAGSPRTVRNPFTFDERYVMIAQEFKTNKLWIEPLYDKTYNNEAWVKQVQDIVNDIVVTTCGHSAKIGLIGCSKDNTSYYLKLFPTWGSVNVEMHNIIHATGIRRLLFEGAVQKHEIYDNALPGYTADWIYSQFVFSDTYKKLKEEYDFIIDYKKQWLAAPYPVKHVTCDAVVVQSGHVLLVKRKANPGQGKWALPGGHLDEHETIEDGIIRELREETKIKVPEKVLRGSLESIRVFDDPHRSCLGRVITHCGLIRLEDALVLADVRGADDAEKAKWIPISEIKEDRLFDDHFAILNISLGLN